MWTIDRPGKWVGRGQELAVLRAGVEALGRGEGAVVWVEGEPGIGKSSLVAEALAAGGGASVTGIEVLAGLVDELSAAAPTVEASRRGGDPDRATWAIAAVLRYWLGEWDEALAELGPDESPGTILSLVSTA